MIFLRFVIKKQLGNPSKNGACVSGAYHNHWKHNVQTTHLYQNELCLAIFMQK